MTRDYYAEGLALSAASRHAEAIECFEEALAERPRDIAVLFALGATASTLGLPGPAEAFYRQVLALAPDRLEALVNLANLLRANGQFETAIALLVPAVSRSPDAAELWLTLGSVYRETGDVDRAAAFYSEALARRPDYPPAMGNLADILADEGRFDDALSLYDRAIACEPGNAQAKLNRAIVHFLRGDLPKAWPDYAARLKIPGKAPCDDRRIPAWTGTPLHGERLLVTAEQGVGDQIMFASLFPELAARAVEEGGTLILECEKRLLPLFSRSFPHAVLRASRIESKGGIATAHHDWMAGEGRPTAAIEMGSLPQLLRPTLGDFPAPHRYLAADASEVQFWREELPFAGRRPWIGICWRSGKSGGGRATQYAPLPTWAQFIRTLPGSIISVQYDATPDELFLLEKLSGRRIYQPENLDQKNELDRTAAMLQSLDAVVSAPTAVSWLSAAGGVPTAKILYDTSWTAFGRPHEPFAPACALMMPDRRGDFASALEKAGRWVSELRDAV